MAMPWDHHNRIIVESFQARALGSKGEIRVRPILGQIYPTEMQVQFSRQARTLHPVGTRFRIWVKESNIQGGNSFLQSPWQWPYEVVD
jgi:hypothetical protein